MNHSFAYVVVRNLEFNFKQSEAGNFAGKKKKRWPAI